MKPHSTPHPGPLPDAMQTVLETIRRDGQVHLIVQGPPLAVARLQAALEAVDPGLSTSSGAGMMDGDCLRGSVLLYWTLGPGGEPAPAIQHVARH